MFFWNSLAFSTISQMLAIWSLVPLLFLNPAWAFSFLLEQNSRSSGKRNLLSCSHYWASNLPSTSACMSPEVNTNSLNTEWAFISCSIWLTEETNFLYVKDYYFIYLFLGYCIIWVLFYFIFLFFLNFILFLNFT